jgi:hypothetical protein
MNRRIRKAQQMRLSKRVNVVMVKGKLNEIARWVKS